ncbi:MAG: hypothetical protein CVU06_01295 [Bacteroidetes bacterium HGW-Bacteroidetes-22]|nr:MAG: hypothetical protein CVU06_01295 [Bacteroidetes bacterium HGW-Bacteroidetes-22]
MTSPAIAPKDHLYRVLFEQASDGMLVIDGFGKILDANQLACLMLDFPREDLLGLNFNKLFKNELIEEFLRSRSHDDQRKAIRITAEFVKKNDDLTHYNIKIRQFEEILIINISDMAYSLTTWSESGHLINRPVIQHQLAKSINISDMEVKFTDIFDLEEIQKIQDAFAESVGLASVIISPEGEPITLPSNFCEFCKQVRTTKEGHELCTLSDATLGKLSEESGIAIRNCMNGGLLDAATRIHLGKKTIAYWMIGQVITSDDDEKKMIAHTSKLGYDQLAVKKILSCATRMTSGQFAKIAATLQLIANQLSESAFHNLQQANYIAERRQTARDLASSIKMLQRQQAALTELSNYPGVKQFDLQEFIKLITKKSALAMEVEYASVWLGNETEGQLLCLDRYTTSKDIHSRGEVMFMKQYPEYFKSMGIGRIIDASDVCTDERMIEFVNSDYINKFNITSTLDITINVLGRLAGTICFEDTGDCRKWTQEEIHFTGEIADKMAMGLLTSQRTQTENDLRESELRFRQMFNNNSVVMMQSDPDTGYILDVNPAAVSFYGYSRAEMLNMYIGQINTLSTGEIYSVMQKTRKSKQHYFVFNHRLKTGEIRKVEAYESAITLHSRDILFSIIHDITNRVVMEEENRKLTLAIEQSPTSMLITDADGNIEYVNQRFEEITGYQAAEVKGRNPSLLKSGLTSANIYEDLWRTIKAGFTWRGELINKKKDGTLFTESVIITPIASDDQKTHHFLALKEDITIRKQMESDLMAAKEKAEESDRLKTAFLNNMSHEIRTPMNAISGFADLLKDADLTEEERNKYVDIINSNSDQLLGIVNDVLEISRLDSGRIPLHLSQFSLNDLLEDIYQSFQPEVTRRKLNYSFYCALPKRDSIVETDKEKIRQIIIGFISNALKFTDKGSITFGYTCTADQIKFYVTDTGIGIPDIEQSRVFDRFYQVVQAEGKSRGGTGLGLSIAQGIARLLQGTISVKSSSGEGSTFYLIIRNCILKNRPEKENPEGKHYGLKKAIVLIAEDEYYNFEYLKALLSKHVAQIHHAANGLIATKLAETIKPDIILMDIKMPVMDGVEATRCIMKSNPNQVIIAQTAYSQPEELNRMTDAGCVICITKPIRREELLSTMAKFQ